MSYLSVVEIEKLTFKKGGRGLHVPLDENNVITSTSDLFVSGMTVKYLLRATILHDNDKTVGYIPIVEIDQ
jgi:hypothetical protein